MMPPVPMLPLVFVLFLVLVEITIVMPMAPRSNRGHRNRGVAVCDHGWVGVTGLRVRGGQERCLCAYAKDVAVLLVPYRIATSRLSALRTIATDVVHTPSTTLLQIRCSPRRKLPPPGQNGYVERLIGSIRQPKRMAGPRVIKCLPSGHRRKTQTSFSCNERTCLAVLPVRRILEIRWDAKLASGAQKVCCSTVSVLG